MKRWELIAISAALPSALVWGCTVMTAKEPEAFAKLRESCPTPDTGKSWVAYDIGQCDEEWRTRFIINGEPNTTLCRRLIQEKGERGEACIFGGKGG